MNGSAGAAEALLKGIRGGGIGEAEADVELFCLVPTVASANWDAAFTVKGIKLEALVAEPDLRGSPIAAWWSATQVTLSGGAACALAAPVLEYARVPQ